MNVLSLFDGLSGAQCALKKLGILPDKYFASEIDEYAQKITMKNFPNTVQLGDVLNWRNWNLPKIDLLIGGSPCQDLSIANSNGKGLEGAKSSLFWKYVEILNELKPRYFVLENVESMKTKDFVLITNTLGVEPIMLDAGKVSAQRRKRYFWTNIPNVTQPKIVPSKIFPNNKIGLVIADILEPNAVRKLVNIAPERIIKTSYGVRWNGQHFNTSFGIQRQSPIDAECKSRVLDANLWKTGIQITNSNFHGLQGRQAIETDKKYCPIDATFGKRQTAIIDHNSQQNRAFQPSGKFGVLAGSRTSSKTIFVFDDVRIEKLTWTEIERLAGLADGYTDLGENNKVEHRGRAIGNGFQIDIVAHLLSFLRGFPEPLQRASGRLKGEQIGLFI